MEEIKKRREYIQPMRKLTGTDSQRRIVDSIDESERDERERERENLP